MCHPGRGRAARQRGFSLVELSIVLLALGVLGWAVAGSYGNAGTVRDRDGAVQTAETLREALRAFALRNGRLPCPDSAGAGWEGDASGACIDGVEAGWLPYRTLGLDVPQDALRAAYGVYRNKAATGATRTWRWPPSARATRRARPATAMPATWSRDW